MSEGPQADRAPQEPEPSSPAAPSADEVLAAQLQRRGARQPPRTLAASIAARVGETVPERRWRLALTAWRPRVAVAASGMALALLAGLLFLGGPAQRPSTAHGSPTPSATSVDGLTWDPVARALTPPEFVQILAARPARGTVVIVDDQIMEQTAACPAVGSLCWSASLANARIPVEPPSGGRLPFSNAAASPTASIDGPLALRIDPGPKVVFLGSVARNGPRMAFTAHDLAVRSATGGLFVIPAWLSTMSLQPCPSSAASVPPDPTSELGLPAPQHPCFPTDWLTDQSSTIPEPGGVFVFPVQPGAYRSFAEGPDGAGSPRQGVYLVRDWPGYGEILARLPPMPIPSTVAIAPSVPPTGGPTPGTADGSTTPAPSRSPSPSAIVLTQDRMVAGITSGSFPTGGIVIARVTIAPLILPSFPPDQGAIAGKIGPITVHWASDPGLRVNASHIIALRVRADGDLDYLGSVELAGGGGPYESSAVPSGPGLGLVLVHGWLYRSGYAVPCTPLEPGPTTPPLFRSLDGRQLAVGCDQAWIVPTDLGPAQPIGVGTTWWLSDGSLTVQNGTGPTAMPTEGLFLVRPVVCSWTPSGSEGCGLLHDSWEFVGRVFIGAP